MNQQTPNIGKARECDRCGIPECETEMQMLAYNGSRLVCSECDSDLDNEWVAEDPVHNIHPLDTLNPFRAGIWS